MSRAPRTASIAASPVLIGAATVLVALVAVFIAYNANSGLPFVPTYELKAELPSGAKLVKGNEVRVGGFRVGVVEDIKPKVTTVERRARAASPWRDLKLDKKIEPLAATRSCACARAPRSASSTSSSRPGTSKATWQSGDTIPVKHASEPLEFEDLFSTFDRDDAAGHPDRAPRASATRSPAAASRLNRAIAALNPFFRALTPVMQNLSDAEHRARPASSSSSARVRRAGGAGGRVRRRELFTDMADTFAAISADPRALQETIEKSPPTMDGVDRLVPRAAAVPGRLRRPLARGCGPAAQELPRSLPAINRAFAGRHAGAAAHGRAERAPRDGLRRGGGPVREPEHAARAARTSHTALTVTPPGARVHRAVPDRLQLLQLLHPPARRDAVGGPGPARPAAARS